MEAPNAQDAAASSEDARIQRDAAAALRGQYDDEDPDPRDRSAILVVLSVNDVHDMLPSHGGRGGIAGLATLLDRERAKIPANATVLVTLNGDFLNGSELDERLRGEHTIELLEHVGIDFVVLGHHEFDFGEQVLRERIAATKRFTWLGSNVLDRCAGATLLSGITDTAIVPLHDGLRLGLFGVVTSDTPNSSNPGDNILFDDVVATAKRCVASLRAQGADMILALTHLHLEDDKMLARHVPEIDVMLGGHDHEPYTLYEGRTLIHKSGQNALWLARLEFELSRSGRHPDRPLAITPQWSMIKNQHIPAQPACEELIVKWLRVLAAQDDPEQAHRVLATVAMPLSTDTKQLRSSECNAGNLVADALRAELAADFGMINGGFIRGDSAYDVGDTITMATLNHEMPFPRPAVLVRILARDFCAALLEQFRFYPHVSSTYPHISGLRVTIQDGPTRQLTACTLENGDPIDLDKLVLVATTDFVAHGGDGCFAWKKGEILETRERATIVVAAYLAKLERIAYPAIERRLVVVD